MCLRVSEPLWRVISAVTRISEHSYQTTLASARGCRGRLRVLLQHLSADLRAVDIPLRIDRDTLDSRVVVLLGSGFGERNERRHLAVARAADVDASLEARILLRVGLRVG